MLASEVSTLAQFMAVLGKRALVPRGRLAYAAEKAKRRTVRLLKRLHVRADPPTIAALPMASLRREPLVALGARLPHLPADERPPAIAAVIDEAADVVLADGATPVLNEVVRAAAREAEGFAAGSGAVSAAGQQARQEDTGGSAAVLPAADPLSPFSQYARSIATGTMFEQPQPERQRPRLPPECTQRILGHLVLPYRGWAVSEAGTPPDGASGAAAPNPESAAALSRVARVSKGALADVDRFIIHHRLRSNWDDDKREWFRRREQRKQRISEILCDPLKSPDQVRQDVAAELAQTQHVGIELALDQSYEAERDARLQAVSNLEIAAAANQQAIRNRVIALEELAKKTNLKSLYLGAKGAIQNAGRVRLDWRPMITTIRAILANNPQLFGAHRGFELDFSGLVLEPSDLDEFASMRLPANTSLGLRHQFISPVTAFLLATHPSITRLDASGLRTDKVHHHHTSAAEVLAAGPWLTMLKLDGCHDASSDLARQLIGRTKIPAVSLRRCPRIAYDLAAIANELKSNPWLTWLDLQRCEVTQEGARMLVTHPSLKYLDLRDNELSPKCKEELGDLKSPALELLL